MRDWPFIDDHIESLILVASKALIGKRYCIGGSNEKKNREVLETICKISDQSISKETCF